MALKTENGCFLTILNQKFLQDIKNPLRIFIRIQKLSNFTCLTMIFYDCHYAKACRGAIALLKSQAYQTTTSLACLYWMNFSENTTLCVLVAIHSSSLSFSCRGPVTANQVVLPQSLGEVASRKKKYQKKRQLRAVQLVTACTIHFKYTATKF